MGIIQKTTNHSGRFFAGAASGLLAICLLFSGFSLRVRAESSMTIQLMGDNSFAPAGGQADNIYFGNYQQSDVTGKQKEPIKWRVLSNDGTKLLLLSDRNLDVWMYHDGWEDVVWEDSDMRNWLNHDFLLTAFDIRERICLSDTPVKEPFSQGGSTRKKEEMQEQESHTAMDKVFLLSVEDARNTDYFPDYNFSRIATNTAYTAAGGGLGIPGLHNPAGEAEGWWLQFPGNSYSYAAYVSDSGNVFDIGNVVYQELYAVRPACYVNLDYVLFLSAVKEDYTSRGAGTNASATAGSQGQDWKLTLFDEKRGFHASYGGDCQIRAEDTLVIDYTGAVTGSREYISAMLVQEDRVLYYDTLLSPEEQDGTVEVKLPSDLAEGKYLLYVFNEQLNGDNQTDYASDFSGISLTIIHTTPQPLAQPVQPTFQEGTDICLDLSGLSHPAFLEETVRALEETAGLGGGSVTVVTDPWVSFNHRITEALLAHLEVALTLDYRYEGNRYRLTIPEGYEADRLLDENGWAGFRRIESMMEETGVGSLGEPPLCE